MIRNLLALTGLAAIALLTAIALQASAYFDDRGDPPPRLPVSYAGLDLASPEGVRMLEGRINGAIDRICDRSGERGVEVRQDEQTCRRAALASVEPQVADALTRARLRYVESDDVAGRSRDDRPVYDDDRYADADRGYDDGGYADAGRASYPPASPPAEARDYPAPPPAASAPPRPGMRLLRRTTVTKTVTTTRSAVPAPVAKPTKAIAKPAVRVARRAYARHPVPGSWLPPAAWRGIERATLRAFARGRLTRWVVADREGYVTVSPVRRIAGCACRNVRVVKYAYGRQIVVASGTRCRRPGGRLS